MGRRPLDAYYTPANLARALVATLPITQSCVVLEPHAGGGAFVDALLEVSSHAHAFDIDPEAPGLTRNCKSMRVDFLSLGELAHVDWIVGNPPYRDAEAHVRQALKLAPNVAFLLRLAFLESTRRIPFWAEHPPYSVTVLAQRPSFIGGKTDSSAYGWFVWRQRHLKPPTLNILDWKKGGGSVFRM